LPHASVSGSVSPSESKTQRSIGFVPELELELELLLELVPDLDRLGTATFRRGAGNWYLATGIL